MGGCQLRFGNLKGLSGSDSSSLKKCFNLRDLLRLENSLRIIVREGGEDGGMYLSPKLSSCVSCLVRRCLDRLWILLTMVGLYESGFQYLVRGFLLRGFLV